MKAGRPISERESTSSDLSRLIIGNILTLGTGLWLYREPSFLLGLDNLYLRRSTKFLTN